MVSQFHPDERDFSFFSFDKESPVIRRRLFVVDLRFRPALSQANAPSPAKPLPGS